MTGEAFAAFWAKQQACGNCGGFPCGIGCYHICFNSIHFYTPEQERADEANWSRADYYHEAGYDDPDYYEVTEEVSACQAPVNRLLGCTPTDDIPF